MRIEVAQSHIDRANKETDDCPFCPIEYAILDHLKREDEGVAVARREVYIDEGIYDLPHEAIDFISRFDAGLKVEPFEFSLDTGDDFPEPEEE